MNDCGCIRCFLERRRVKREMSTHSVVVPQSLHVPIEHRVSVHGDAPQVWIDHCHAHIKWSRFALMWAGIGAQKSATDALTIEPQEQALLDAVYALAEKGGRGIAVAPNSRLNEMRKAKGLPPITWLPADTDGLA